MWGHVASAIDWLTQKDEWQGLQTLVEVHSTRESMSEKSQQTRYFLTSLPPQPHMILAAVRAHWRVENPLHWSLDVTFAEDDNRTRHKNIARNHSLIRKAALNTSNSANHKNSPFSVPENPPQDHKNTSLTY